MTIAVFSDIHGSHIAFKTCLDYALEKGADTFLLLGDYLGELAYPKETIEMLYELKEKYPCYFVRGNKEDYWQRFEDCGEQGWKEFDSTTGALYYAYNEMTKEDWDFFRAMPLSQVIRLKENMPEFIICHGSPNSTTDQLLVGSELAYKTLEELQEVSLLICGHTHCQAKIDKDGKRILNPGAIGTPLESGGMTQFMLLHEENGNWQEEFVSLDYDREAVIEELKTSGLYEKAPYWCKITENLLYTGEPSHGKVLGRAMQLCYEETGECIWPDISDKYYKRAIDELINKGN